MPLQLQVPWDAILLVREMPRHSPCLLPWGRESFVSANNGGNLNCWCFETLLICRSNLAAAHGSAPACACATAAVYHSRAVLWDIPPSYVSSSVCALAVRIQLWKLALFCVPVHSISIPGTGNHAKHSNLAIGLARHRSLLSLHVVLDLPEVISHRTMGPA